jgi:hypothetical protein
MTRFFALQGLRNCFLSALFIIYSYLGIAQNAIVTENALLGSVSSQWDISGAGDLTIQGFATDISVNRGNTVHFKINTDANAYTIEVYRLGYYQGNGARYIGTATITATIPQTQPAPLNDATSGLTDFASIMLLENSFMSVKLKVQMKQ